MLTQEIRRKFLKYFESKGHAIVPSSPVIPHGDPTLLFINAGMNQFKDVFLGESVRDYKRATTSQKCIRAGGKHNDLENVGHTSRHLTFFEMLGNFSFGDYFKEDAVRFAWEVATEVFGLNPDRIWPTVYTDDQEAFDLWTSYVPADRIYRFGEEENFWSMGDTGPCGPCSELLYDRGSDFGDGRNPHEDPSGERFFEFWNLVFMQYERHANGELQALPKQSIDTGSGLERIVSLLMNEESLFGTDVLRSLMAKVEGISGKKYEKGSKSAPAFHVIADHIRSLCFAISDGVQPSNLDRGYVLRKILRRAVRYGRSLGIEKPFLVDMVPTMVDLMGEDFPELKSAQSRLEEIILLEEEGFARTLQRGGNILNGVIQESLKKGSNISGDDAFKLKDTYGFPLEEILLIAKDANLEVDCERFRELTQEAKERSRAAQKSITQTHSEGLFEGIPASKFLGYEQNETKGKVVAIAVEGKLCDSLEEGQEGLVVLDQSPFYAEQGGQVGDSGTLNGDGGLFEVHDCLHPFTGIIAHLGSQEKGSLKVGDEVQARINVERRQAIANNHSATHLLHWALYQVLGDHVRQAGSVVDEKRLRFDFNHHKGLGKEEIRKIEDLVNQKIAENAPVEDCERKFSEVQKDSSIKQFFGDKYGSTVRVVSMDEFSKELCGGTHTSRLGNISCFAIAKESSIAAGVRRIEAVTGREAIDFFRSREDLIEEIAQTVRAKPAKLMDRLQRLLEENKSLGKQLKEAQQAQAQGLVSQIVNNAEKIKGINLLAQEVDVAPGDLRDLANNVMDSLKTGIVILAASSKDRCQIVAKVSPDLLGKGMSANTIIKTLAPILGGGGGGKADMAQAGGTQPQMIPEALAKAKELI